MYGELCAAFPEASLRHDYDAVRAALALPWSNGQVARLKLVKRLMDGRANSDLLRLRTLWKPEARFHQKCRYVIFR